MAEAMYREKCWQWSKAGIMWLEGVISKEQFEIIRLAFIGLGIYFKGKGWCEGDWDYWDRLDDHPVSTHSYSNPDVLFIEDDDDGVPLSFSRLCMELVSQKPHLSKDAPYLLYVMLFGVGVNETLLEEAGFDRGTEIDIEFLHTEYSWFSSLLAVGNMVMSMTDSEYEEFSSDIGWGYKSRCNFIASSEFCREFRSDVICSSGILAEFLHDHLKFEYASYVDHYFDSLRQKIRAPRMAQIALQNTVQKGMEEGYVSLNNIKMVICGPPFVGKTAFKHLLLNKPPPLKHNSTPIAARPIQAIERIAAGDNTWEEVSEEDLLHMLSDAIEKKNTQSLHDNSTDAARIVSKICLENTTPSSLQDVSAATNSAVLVALPFELAGGNTREEELLSDVIEKKATQSLQDEYSISEIDSISSSLEDVPVDASLVALPVAQKALHVKATDFVSRTIIKQLSKERKGPQKLLEATWIHLLDSGGQPQFIDLLHMFMRDNSLYVIVMKVTESLHGNPMFVYSLNGSPLNIPQEMTMTNLQIIESFVHSVAVASRFKTTKPAFAIVATNCDRSRFTRFIGLNEKLKTKNKVLQECLSEFLDLFVFYNRDSNELIFPVDNLCRWNRQKISADIRSRLLCSHSDISFNVKIPIRWYIFDLNMKKEASMETHGIISLESCINIGRNFGMNRSEVVHCLNYLDSMRLCIYYPNVIPHVVFTSPQFLIDCLSNIVRVSFVDDLQQILPEGVSLPDKNVLSLKRDGVFDESLLDNLGLTFLPNLFSKSNLLSLLQHFRLISPVKTACDVYQYFIPVLLPAERLTEKQKAIFGSSLDPLIITFKGQLVLQVSKKFISSYIVFLYRVCFQH